MAPPAVHSKPFARASLLLIGLAWTVPFLQPRHRYPLTAFYGEWLAFGIGLAAALLLAGRQSWREAELPVIALMPPALALIVGVQGALGSVPYPEQSVTVAMYLLWASLLIVLACVLARELGMAPIASTLAWFLLAGGLLSALAGYAQQYHFDLALDHLVTRKLAGRVYGNLGQPNHFATYLTMALCSVTYLYGRNRLSTGWAVSAAAFLLPALALSGSRSPWFYLAIVATVSLLLFLARRDAESRRLLAFSLCLAPGFVVAGFVVTEWGGAGAVAGAAMTQEATSAQRLFEAAAGLAPRVQLAAEAWQMFLSAPGLGVGWGQFAWHHFTYAAATGAAAAPGVYNHAHDIVLHLLAETGAAGGLLVAGACLLWLVDLKGIKLDLEWWWVLALLGVLGAHSMLEYPLWYSYFLGIAAVLLGLGATRTIRLRLPGLARLTVAALMAAGWFNLISIMPYYREFERLVFLPDNRSVRMDEKTFIEAITRIHREPVLTPYVELALAFSLVVDEANLAKKLDIVSRVARFAPVSYVVYRQSLFLALAGDREAALTRLKQSARVYPGDLPGIRAEIGRLADKHPDVFAPLLEVAAAAQSK